MTKTTRNILIVAAVFLLCLSTATVLALRWVAKTWSPDVVTDLSAYTDTLKQWPTSLVSHFPPTIPADATNIHFSTFPGFLQGGAWIQLRLQLPSEEIKAIASDFTKKSKDIYTNGGDIFSHYNEDQAHNLATTNFYTADTPKSSTAFPPDYTFYLLKSRNAGNWNHGDSAGVVISAEKNEIIYWADHW